MHSCLATLTSLRLALIILCFGIMSSISLADNVPADNVQPHPALTPDQVVRIQINALGNNNNPEENAGIALAFRFASPANRRLTGPLERFIRMVNNPLYEPMLNHRRAEYGPVSVDGDSATQVVILTTADGNRAGYWFSLSKQQSGECEGCWMTDSVVRLEIPEQIEI